MFLILFARKYIFIHNFSHYSIPHSMNKTSKLFWPVLVTPRNAVIKNTEAISRSQKLMTELGLIKTANNGTFQVLPIAQRAVDKCIDLLNRHMRQIDGQKLSLPVLTSTSLWKKSGRLDGDITEFYMVHDRHGKDHLLSPTHEEAMTAMIAESAPISYRQLPLRLYQIGPKFRDELKARFGLLRAKEFLMKDMYTFDKTMKDARISYDLVNQAYETLFKKLQVPFIKVQADTGIMGGSLSHEYHFLSTAGEDKLRTCSSCDYAANIESCGAQFTCPQCNLSTTLNEVRGIEIGHTFLLGDKYSKPLGATYLQSNGKPKEMIMGCYGIGVTRLIAAALEVLASENNLRWPMLLAPFDVCVIGPKEGSKEQQDGDKIEQTLCTSLSNIFAPEDLLHDDRKFMTIGKRLMEAKKMGYPLIIIVGSKVMQVSPIVELHKGENMLELTPGDVLNVVSRYHANKQVLLNGLESQTSGQDDEKFCAAS